MLRPHRLMLHPRGSSYLTILNMSLRCSPTAVITWTDDVFGNLIGLGVFEEPTAELEIVSHFMVDQSASEWPVVAIAPDAHQFPFSYSAEDTLALRPFQAREPGIPNRIVESWARGFVTARPTDTLALLKEINLGVLDSVQYRVRLEEGTQTALDTLIAGSGSCRDVAALFIDAVRALGFGARAVSGYLHDPFQREADHGSTHAWAEVYLPGAGWITFDPTRQRFGAAGLIPVAVGRSSRQLLPVTGGYMGEAKDFIAMDVAVSVTAEVADAVDPHHRSERDVALRFRSQ